MSVQIHTHTKHITTSASHVPSLLTVNNSLGQGNHNLPIIRLPGNLRCVLKPSRPYLENDWTVASWNPSMVQQLWLFHPQCEKAIRKRTHLHSLLQEGHGKLGSSKGCSVYCCFKSITNYCNSYLSVVT